MNHDKVDDYVVRIHDCAPRVKELPLENLYWKRRIGEIHYDHKSYKLPVPKAVVGTGGFKIKKSSK